MTYSQQILTNDFLLQLKTEVDANTIAELQYKAIKMIKQYPEVIGMTYRIFEISGVGTSNYKTRLLHQSTING